MLEFINAGLIGYGYAGKTLHAPLLNGTPGIRLHAITSRDANKVKRDWPAVSHYPTPEAMLAAPDIDLVVIATPNDTHFPLAKAALLAGKHVVVDKPFTLSHQEAKELIALAHAQDLQLSIFHNRRWDADFLTLRRLLAKGELGEVLHFESHFDRFRPEVRDRWREQAVAGSGLWYDLGAHLLDQSLQLFGKPDTLWLDLAQQRPGAQTDDYFHAVLQYGERRVILHASTQVPHHTPRFTLHGRLGSYHKYGLDPQEEQLKQGRLPTDEGFGIDPQPGQLVTVAGEERRIQTIANQPGCYLEFYRGMQQAIQRGTPVPVKAEEAALVMELIELGVQSARLGQRLTLGKPLPATPDALKSTPLPPPALAASTQPHSTPAPRSNYHAPSTPQARPSQPISNTPSSAFSHERAPVARSPQVQRAPLPKAIPGTHPTRASLRPSEPASQPVRPQEHPRQRPLSAHPAELGARAPLASEPLAAASRQGRPEPIPSQASITQSSTGFIRTDKPRGVSPTSSAFSAAKSQPEPSRPTPTHPHQPGSAPYNAQQKMPLAAQPAAPVTTSPPASRSPLSSYGRSAQFQPGSAAKPEPAFRAQEESSPEQEMLIPELSPSSLIAREHEAGLQAGKRPLLPRMSVKDEEDPEDDLPSFTAR